jgi:hypothetical protein
MPSSAVRTFSDPDDYAAAIRQGTVEMTITGRGQFSAKLVQITLHRLWMQRFSDSLPRVSHIAGWGGRAVIGFRTYPGPNLVASGVEMQPTNIVRYSEGQSYHRYSSGIAKYAGMSLPVEDMAVLGAMLGGCDLTPPRDPLSIRPASHAIAKLQRLHAAAAHLAENAPEIIANPAAAHYGEACGWVLARAHAKAGDPWVISGYLGKNAQFDEAMGKFALAYADQAERDHAALRAAVRAGIVEVQLEH